MWFDLGNECQDLIYQSKRAIYIYIYICSWYANIQGVNKDPSPTQLMKKKINIWDFGYVYTTKRGEYWVWGVTQTSYMQSRIPFSRYC